MVGLGKDLRDCRRVARFCVAIVDAAGDLGYLHACPSHITAAVAKAVSDRRALLSVLTIGDRRVGDACCAECAEIALERTRAAWAERVASS